MFYKHILKTEKKNPLDKCFHRVVCMPRQTFFIFHFVYGASTAAEQLMFYIIGLKLQALIFYILRVFHSFENTYKSLGFAIYNFC